MPTPQIILDKDKHVFPCLSLKLNPLPNHKREKKKCDNSSEGIMGYTLITNSSQIAREKEA